MADRRPTARRHPGADRICPELARHTEGGVLIGGGEGRRDTRSFTGDAVAEITRLKADDDEPMRVGGATIAGAAMPAGLVDEYTIVTHPVLVGGGTPFFTALDSWVNLNLVETRTFPGGVVMTGYERRQ